MLQIDRSAGTLATTASSSQLQTICLLAQTRGKALASALYESEMDELQGWFIIQALGIP